MFWRFIAAGKGFGFLDTRERSINLYWVLSFFFGKLTYVLKENDTKNIMGIPKIYNVDRNENQQMATGKPHNKTKN